MRVMARQLRDSLIQVERRVRTADWSNLSRHVRRSGSPTKGSRCPVHLHTSSSPTDRINYLPSAGDRAASAACTIVLHSWVESASSRKLPYCRTEDQVQHCCLAQATEGKGIQCGAISPGPFPAIWQHVHSERHAGVSMPHLCQTPEIDRYCQRIPRRFRVDGQNVSTSAFCLEAAEQRPRG